ncbi:flagellar hook-basal body complex protein FliE [Paenibacillus sp. FSL H8-0548]|uniref:flagellar hook-basal body complex protein FliE n=1 Tax=Paenibacillus sp. FSL H8-0548 TaxID=1920422 RepID=UPI00096EC7CA|nr:flagellar hook-basal body complex protein FliE [Paenibacillus sp. FSL H8-0548]OMF36812.1 flagellar hook-basal body complex protein FliE [Paenibacillus sp. FSL H8-0548]
MIQSMMLGSVQPVKITEATSIQQATPAQATQSFGEFLQTAIEGVNSQEQNVHKLNDKYLIGEVDVSKVLIASEQSLLSLQLTSQIRNKVVEAYQEIMRMQI